MPFHLLKFLLSILYINFNLKNICFKIINHFKFEVFAKLKLAKLKYK